MQNELNPAQRILISSGAKWEEIVGYSRAVKVGNIIEISGTTATDGDEIIGKGNVYEQTVFILKKIEKTLVECGAGLEHVTRTRMFVTYISGWQEVARAHALFFKKIKPATSMIEIKSLIDKELLIEIEATAVLQ